MEEPMRKRSDELTVGIERSAHRALLYSTGMTRSDFDKPLVAVVNSWNEIVPGHIHLREIAEQVKLSVTEAGGCQRNFTQSPYATVCVKDIWECNTPCPAGM